MSCDLPKPCGCNRSVYAKSAYCKDAHGNLIVKLLTHRQDKVWGRLQVSDLHYWTGKSQFSTEVML